MSVLRLRKEDRDVERDEVREKSLKEKFSFVMRSKKMKRATVSDFMSPRVRSVMSDW